MKTITLTPAQLTLAQRGKEQPLNTGETLCAVPLREGAWKYIVSFEGVVGLVRYAPAGLTAALWALNASEEDYTEANPI
jgi:hypothetical protein